MKAPTPTDLCIRYTIEPIDLGLQTPAFPDAEFRIISTRADAESTLAPDQRAWMKPTGAALDAFYDAIVELNAYPKLITTHAIGGIDDRSSDPAFQWATCRA